MTKDQKEFFMKVYRDNKEAATEIAMDFASRHPIEFATLMYYILEESPKDQD